MIALHRQKQKEKATLGWNINRLHRLKHWCNCFHWPEHHRFQRLAHFSKDSKLNLAEIGVLYMCFDILRLVTYGVNSADANITTVGLNSINAKVLIFRVVSNYICATKWFARNDRSYRLFVYLVFLLFVDAIDWGVNRNVTVPALLFYFIFLLTYMTVISIRML